MSYPVYTIKEVNKGDTWKGISFKIANDSGFIDITDADVIIQFKTDEYSRIVVKQFTTTDNTITKSLPYQLVIPSQDILFASGPLIADIKIKFSDNRILTVLGLKWNIKQTISEFQNGTDNN